MPMAGCRGGARLIRLQELKLKRSKTMTYKLNIRRITLGLLPIIALVFGGALAATSQTSAPRNVKNIVLIHGGFVDGSGWEGVYNTLKKKGYNITIVQNPTISLADDVAVTKRVIAPQDGFLSLDRSKFVASFAADVNPGLVAFMADSQVPWGVQALSGMVSEPAWKSKPSWYLVSTEDKMIPPDAQRAMSKRAGSKVVEVKGSHAIYVSQPRAVASLIEQAANGSVSTEK